MDVVSTCRMSRFTVNINRKTYVNEIMSAGNGYWVSTDWNIAISTPFP